MPLSSRIGSRFRAELIAQIITALSGGLLITLLARLLGPEEYGLLYLALSFFAMMEMVSKLGIHRSAGRYISNYKEDSPSQIPHIVIFSFIAVSILVTLNVFVVYAFDQQIASLIGEEDLQSLLMVGVLFLLFTSMIDYSRSIFQGLEDIKSASYIIIIERTGRLIFTLTIVILGFGAVGALVGHVISTAIAAAVGLLYLYHSIKASYSIIDEMEKGLKRRILEYSVPLTMTNAAGVLNKHLDILLIGYFLNPIAVSYYTISKQIIEFIETPVKSLGFTLAPTFGAQKSSGSTKKAANLYQEAITHTLALYIPASAGMYLVADSVVDLVFGEEYLGAIPVLQILSIYITLVSINFIAGKALDFLGRARARAVAKGLTSVANVILNLILIPILGVVGAAIATLITYTIYVIANVYIIHAELNVDTIKVGIDVVKIILITILMSVIVHFIQTILSTGWLPLFISVGTGIAVWAVCISIIDIIDTKRVIRSIL